MAAASIIWLIQIRLPESQFARDRLFLLPSLTWTCSCRLSCSTSLQLTPQSPRKLLPSSSSRVSFRLLARLTVIATDASNRTLTGKTGNTVAVARAAGICPRHRCHGSQSESEPD